MDRLESSVRQRALGWLGPTRREAVNFFEAGVAAADPERAVARALRFQNDNLELRLDSSTASSRWRCENWTTVHVVAFGKAACATSKAVQDILPRSKTDGKGIAVTNVENVVATPNTDVFDAGHPLPNQAGQKAAWLIADRVGRAKAGELVLVLISGGGSALFPYPPDNVPLADKIETTELLLASGATIDEINTVRKHLSQMKGGQLAQHAVPASLHALILSDVIGDELSAIASGPTVPDPSTYADALEVFKSSQTLDKLPITVRRHIQQGCDGEIPETPKPGDPVFTGVTHCLIGSNRMSLDAVEQSANDKRHTSILNPSLCGEARLAAELFVNAAALALDHAPGARLAILAGGETTVTIKGSGLGGRNQEMALAFALAAEEKKLPENWVFLSGGTDGRDGPTNAAGGVVDPWSLQRMRSNGEDPTALLENNDSNRALSASDDLLVTDATGTNVADLQILLIN